MPHYTALVTLFAVLLYFFFAIRVASAHVKFGVKLPAVTGHPDFERVYRVQMNTLEWLPTFLVTLWLFALYLSDRWAAVIGVVWIIGRIAYAIGYSQAVERRVPGFLIQTLACTVLFFGALYGVLIRLWGG
jgi:glutathione S-transferase